MKTAQRGFIVPLLLIIIAILVVGGGAYFYTQNKSENPSVAGNVTLPQATSTTQALTTQSPEQLFIPYPAAPELILKLPARAIIKDNIVLIDNAEFQIIGGMVGLCPASPNSEEGGKVGLSNGVNCTYEDDKSLPNIDVLRFWKDSRGIFSINPQGFKPYISPGYMGIVKTKPNQIFTASEIAFWKEVISKIK
jgi:hypothetical protein